MVDILTRSSQSGILVFLSGTQEIQKCIDVLHTAGIGTRAKILPLHAGLSSEEQSSQNNNEKHNREDRYVGKRGIKVKAKAMSMKSQSQ